MKVCLLLIHDGREDYLERTLLSASEMLPRLSRRVTIDDSAHRLGFAGAIQAGWEQVTGMDVDYVFHLEADFTFNFPVELRAMVELLERHPYLAQVSLKRQPWNERERAAGGIVEADSEDFTECFDGKATWTEHRRYFTTNPSVYPASLCSMGWPQISESEGMFTHRLLEDPMLRFAIWGGKFDPPAVEHIGEVRAGVGY